MSTVESVVINYNDNKSVTVTPEKSEIVPKVNDLMKLSDVDETTFNQIINIPNKLFYMVTGNSVIPLGTIQSNTKEENRVVTQRESMIIPAMTIFSRGARIETSQVNSLSVFSKSGGGAHQTCSQNQKTQTADSSFQKKAFPVSASQIEYLFSKNTYSSNVLFF